jgi:hypothetical protein
VNAIECEGFDFDAEAAKQVDEDTRKVVEILGEWAGAVPIPGSNDVMVTRPIKLVGGKTGTCQVPRSELVRVSAIWLRKHVENDRKMMLPRLA